jgi:polysaccharide deacetylase family protein (PEP-CTERM system associated)
MLQPDTRIVNALTVDVEDYFHVEAFTAHVSQEEWTSLESRVERNTEHVLRILDDSGTKGTFFVLGWVAERFPSLVPRIVSQGHEVGCHGYEHRRIRVQGPERYREDLRRSRDIVASQAGCSVTSYRAPSFSVVSETLWALDMLLEEGFTLDSSIFPVRHDLYGVPDAPRFPHRLRTPGGGSIQEFPASTLRVGSSNIGIAGGGYLRILPYAVTQYAIRRINEVERQPAMVYFHPWEVDPEQPRIRGASLKSRLRHYTNLSRMEGKLRRLLRDFRFGPIRQVLRDPVG